MNIIQHIGRFLWRVIKAVFVRGKDCCKDEHTFLKNNTDQKTAESAFQLVQVMAVAPPESFIENPSDDFYFVTEGNPFKHASSRSYGVGVYIRNCVYII